MPVVPDGSKYTQSLVQFEVPPLFDAIVVSAEATIRFSR
jgi:hypothetical protein